MKIKGEDLKLVLAEAVIIEYNKEKFIISKRLLGMLSKDFKGSQMVDNLNINDSVSFELKKVS